MAEILSSFEFATANRSKYPWGQWFDGRIWRLVADQDFVCKPGTFGVMAKAKAKKMGRPINVKVLEDGVVLQLRPAVSGNGHSGNGSGKLGAYAAVGARPYDE